MIIPKINSAHGSDTRNIINAAIDLINAQGKSIQDLVAEGQLTPTQYAQLIAVVNSNIKHGENESVSWGMLDQVVKENISGDKVAVVGVDSVNTENIVDKATTSLKRTNKGEIGILVTPDSGLIPNFDVGKEVLTVHNGSYVINRGERYLINEDTDIPINKNHLVLNLYFNTETKTFYFVGYYVGGTSSPISESSILIASISFQSGHKEISRVWSTFDLTVNGKLFKNKEEPLDLIDDNLKFGKNKTFDILENTIIGTDGQLVKSSSYGYSHIAFLEPNKQYTIKKHVGGNRFRIALLKEYPTEDKLPLTPDKHYISDDTSSSPKEYTFINDHSSYVLVFTNSVNDDIPLVQVEEGNEATEYERFQWSLFGRSIGEEFSTGKNKFDGNYTNGIYVGVSPIVDVSSSSSSLSAVVPLERGKTYNMKKYEGGDRLRIAILGDFPHTDNLPMQTEYHEVIDNEGDEYNWTFVNNFGKNEINYLVVYTNTNSENIPLIQVEEGTEPTDYKDYEFRYLGKPLKLSGEVDLSGLKTNYFLLDDIQGIYNAPELQSVAPSQSFNLDTSLHTDIYNLYDDIMTENANYITKSLLGNDALDNPIYQYNFTPPVPDSDVDIVRPKIVLISGVHGNEKASVWGLVQFLKDMCENWKEDPILEFFRWNYEFVVVPMVNPSGYDLNQRKNANNVDLNRNFPVPTWINGPSAPDNINYRGSSPASEVETQVMVSFLDENLNADYVIDFHNFFQHNDYLMWLPYLDINENKNLGLNLISTLTRKWKKQYDYFPQDDNQMLGFVNATNGASLKHYGIEVGIKTFTLETVHQVRYGSNSELYDKTTITCAVDLVGNMLTAIAKSSH